MNAGTAGVLGTGEELGRLVDEHYGAMLRFAQIVDRDSDPRAALRAAWNRAIANATGPPDGTSVRGWLLMLVLDGRPLPMPAGPVATARPEELEAPDGRWAGWWKDEQAKTPAADPRVLERLLAALPPAVAAVAVLRDVEALPTEEVAAITGHPPDRQLRFLQYARAALRNELRAGGGS